MALAHFAGKMLRENEASRRNGHGMFERIAKFADISGPVVLDQERERFLGKFSLARLRV